MSWMPNRIAACLIAATSIVALNGTAWAEAIVVNSTGAAARQYPRGTRLADNAIIRITGGSVTVMTQGGTRAYRQMGAYRLDGPRVGTGSVLAAAHNSSGAARSGSTRTLDGIVRSADGEIISIDPARDVWQADVLTGGTVCYLPSASIAMFRPGGGGTSAMLVRISDDARASISWSEGQKILAWPSSLAPEAGQYRIEWADGSATQLALAPISADPADRVATTAALISNHCNEQADILAIRAEQPVSPTPARM